MVSRKAGLELKAEPKVSLSAEILGGGATLSRLGVAFLTTRLLVADSRPISETARKRPAMRQSRPDGHDPIERHQKSRIQAEAPKTL